MLHWILLNYRWVLSLFVALIFLVIFLNSQKTDWLSLMTGVGGLRFNPTTTTSHGGSIYKVVFDAGSTGTRVHVFEFGTRDFSSLELKSVPKFSRVNGGLSDYANTPSDSRDGLLQLIGEAKEAIPESQWSETEVILMATAGLRLLPPEQAESLLRVAREILDESGFRVGTVDTIDGKLEAKLMFVMTHFVSPRNSAIVDLGGGSVQLAYMADKAASAAVGANEYLDSHASSALYLNSWLGYGLVAFRMKALEAVSTGLPHPCVPEWTPLGINYTYGEKSIPVIPWSTTGSPSSDPITACINIIVDALETDRDDGKCGLIVGMEGGRKFLGKKKANGQCGLNGSWLGPTDPSSIEEWRLFSYIFDLAEEEGMVREGDREVVLTGNDFLNSAKNHCSKSAAIEWWKCIDLIYVSALITNGFKLDPDFPLKVTKRLVYDNRIELEAAWPLGAAIAAIRGEL